MSHSPGQGPQWLAPAEAERVPDQVPDQILDQLSTDTYRQPLDTGADEIAPVDRQADPAHWLPGRALIITAVVVGAALVATIVICLLIWLTPPMHHLPVPVVPKG